VVHPYYGDINIKRSHGDKRTYLGESKTILEVYVFTLNVTCDGTFWSSGTCYFESNV